MFISWYKNEDIVDYSVPLNDGTQIPLHEITRFIRAIHSINQYEVNLLDKVRILIENESMQKATKNH